ncbi:hypothetical protein KY366_08470, partial [Candidatus Woesearchaeota archaeon]|nr:hypothetical protein [Candidatus Woesearchaeota archaeon]
MSLLGFQELMEALNRTPEEFLTECPLAVFGLVIIIFIIVWSFTVGWGEGKVAIYIAGIAMLMILFGLTPS